MTPKQKRDGYLRIDLRKDNETYVFFIHRLVLLAFIGPHTKLNDICHHIDGNKANNKLDNLEWSNRSLNALVSPKRTGEYHSKKLHESDVKLLRKLANDGIRQKDLCKMFNISAATVSLIISRKIWAGVSYA